jgi:sialate O-acetylesterase
MRTTADAQGHWRAVLKAEAAGGPYTLKIQGDNLLVLNDVMVGDVWLASGQSNMELTVGQSDNAQREVAQSNFPLIRHVKIPKAVAFQPAADIGASNWSVSSPENTGEFSAAGYFFARKLQQELGVPIGIINASWGGTNIETWLSSDALARQPELALTPLPTDAAQYNTRYRERMMATVARWQGAGPVETGATETWKEIDFDDSTWPTLLASQNWEEQGLEDLDGVVWYRRAFALTPEQAASDASLQLGMIDDCDETYVNGQRVGGLCGWDTPRRYAVPAGLLKAGKNMLAVRVTDTGGGGGFHGERSAMRLQWRADSIALAGSWKARVENLMDKGQPGPNDLPMLSFNAMLRPLTDFPIRGVIWYQGESNVPRAAQYAQTFPLLIADWRAQWHQPRMPFYFVQLASFQPLERNSLAGSPWAELRDAQRQTATLAGTGMVVATDVGNANDIHPRNKQAIGLRLALQALKGEYGKKNIAANGPIYRALRVHGSQLELSFSELGGGLVAAGSDGVLRGFAVADDGRQFRSAQARIQGNMVIVSHPDIKHPTVVRYGWLDNPEQSNLFNRSGLPASPFRTDDWPWLTEGVKYRY